MSQFQVNATRTIYLTAVINADTPEEAETILDEMITDDFAEVGSETDIGFVQHLGDTAVLTQDRVYCSTFCSGESIRTDIYYGSKFKNAYPDGFTCPSCDQVIGVEG